MTIDDALLIWSVITSAICYFLGYALGIAHQRVKDQHDQS